MTQEACEKAVRDEKIREQYFRRLGDEQFNSEQKGFISQAIMRERLEELRATGWPELLVRAMLVAKNVQELSERVTSERGLPGFQLGSG